MKTITKISFKDMYKIVMDQGIKELTKPKKVFMPCSSYDDLELKIKVKIGDRVRIGSEIARSENGVIHSSISGKVIDIVNREHMVKGDVKTVVIENDFKESKHDECVKEENSNFLSPKEIVSRIQKWGVVGRGGSGFPTHLKYKLGNKIDTVILNAAECEPFLVTDKLILRKQFDKVIEGVVFMMHASNAMYAKIAIKEKHKNLIEFIEQALKKLKKHNIDRYKGIELALLPDIYPIGWEKYLVKKVTNRSYDKYPSECNVIVNNVCTALDIYSAIQFNEPQSMKYFTVTGTAIDNPTFYKVKVGTPLNDILKKHKFKEDALVLSGGPMMGKEINKSNLENIVITKRSQVISILEPRKKENVEKNTNVCMKCGKCSFYCPTGLTPNFVKTNKNNKSLLSKIGVNKCILCGVCSYICPSNIELTAAMKDAKKNLRNKEA